jgi:ribulose kinase
MKKLLLVMMGTAMLATAAVAQSTPQKDYKKDHAEWDKKVKEELQLTSDQVTKYDAVSREFNDKLDAVTQDASISKDAMKEKKEALKKEKETKLFEFLTPDQQTKYKELIEKKKKEMQAKPGS